MYYTCVQVFKKCTWMSSINQIILSELWVIQKWIRQKSSAFSKCEKKHFVLYWRTKFYEVWYLLKGKIIFIFYIPLIQYYVAYLSQNEPDFIFKHNYRGTCNRLTFYSNIKRMYNPHNPSIWVEDLWYN